MTEETNEEVDLDSSEALVLSESGPGSTGDGHVAGSGGSERPAVRKTAKLSEEEVKKIVEALGLRNPEWAELAGELGRILDISNYAYGNSTEKSAEILKLLFPDGIRPEQYHGVRCIISILDKLSRWATDKDAFGGSPLRDAAGYALLALRHDLQVNPNRDR